MADHLLRLDANTIGERWTVENFVDPRPLKWELSCILLDSADVPVGFLIASRKQEGAHVHRLVIATGYQGQGWGRRLMNQLEQRARILHLPAITLKVNTANLQAKAFYESIGFHTTGLIGTNFNMQKQLL